jgi:flavin-binding protein dodecin
VRGRVEALTAQPTTANDIRPHHDARLAARRALSFRRLPPANPIRAYTRGRRLARDAVAPCSPKSGHRAFIPTPHWSQAMADHVYKSLELTGSSPKSSDDAIRVAIARASKTVRNMKWFQVTELRGYVEGDQVAHWQVTLKVGFTLEE